MKKHLLTIFFLLPVKIVFSQYFVFDTLSKKPIDRVNIYYNQNKGQITNEDGYFELPYNVIIDTLHFSHLAYKTKKVLFNKLKKNDTIFLNSSIIELDEVILNNINPKDIVIKSINNINVNYVNTPYNLFGFFRQSMQENSRGVEMIEVDFISHINKNKVSTKILDARRTENYSTLGLKTHGGVATIIEEGDFIRKKAHFLNINQLNEYKFVYEGKIKQDDLYLLKISFFPINNKNLHILRKGALYVDSKSFAIIEIKYTFDKNKLSKVSEQSEKNISTKKPFYRLIDIENMIKYKQLPNKKWGLSYLEVYNLREGIFQNKSYNYSINAKLVINDIKTSEVIKVKTNYNLNKDFNKSVKKFNNLKNWHNTYKFSLSKKEKEILKDINNRD